MENIKGKCSDCGDWFYEIEKDARGYFIPDTDETGQIVLNNWGKKTYTQHRHVHQCKANLGNSPNKVNKYEKQIAKESIEEDSRLNQKNIAAMATSMTEIKLRFESFEKQLERLSMDVETFLRHAAKSGAFFKGANEALEENKKTESKDKEKGDSNGNGTNDIVAELTNTDDTTADLDSHSINFVEQDEKDR